MKQNVGILDTAIRSVIACVVLALAVEGMFSTVVTSILVLVGAMLWLSSSFGVCFLYKALGIDTYPDFSDDSFHPQH
ncbi:DUF2892 domain-containing protein [Aestuariibacter halophilus]|uniref:DUF2892 domain-containing protein n=1 Tax=Fluctibacter halophilus TaxID=226011 RepID=A0ABS8GBY4_9ALTE|nr:DUF2892 domain-containing protein [Aestuariibacter halophilus]MCC2617274.1 DUF2892 domain-containing protein [Aestuariibacter halophilus]